MRDMFLNEAFVGADESARRYVPIVNLDRTAFAEQGLDHLDERTLSQIVGVRLERHPEEADPSFPRIQDLLDAELHLDFIAIKNRAEQRRLQIIRFRLVRQ